MAIKIIRLIDRILRLDKTLSTEESLEKEKSFHDIRKQSKEKNKSVVESVLHDMQIIDTKSTALLTHISIMIVVLTFALSTNLAERSLTKGIIIIEIIAYFITALINLRCFYIMGPIHRMDFKDAEDYENKLCIECLTRRTVYMICLKIVFIATAAIPISLVFDYLIILLLDYFSCG